MAFRRIEEENDEEVRFKTFLNYLRQFSAYLKQNVGDRTELARHIWTQSARFQATKNYSREYLVRSLFLAWNTEAIVCNFGLNDPAALKINNHWKPIQVYYAIYSASEALAHLLTGKERFSHKECLRTVSEMLIKTKILPWGCAFKGKLGKNGNDAMPVNFPNDFKLAHNLQVTNVRPIDLIATCLQAEHRKRVDDVYRERRNKRKSGQKIPFKYATDPGETTLLHFAYRLRLRSNYEGAEMYLADLSDRSIRDFDTLLNTFCTCTLMALEIQVMRKVTKRTFLEIQKEFAQRVPMNKTLEERIAIYHTLT
jgi:hypothetical protein